MLTLYTISAESEPLSAGPVWIVKPASRNRGNGIQVFGSLNDIETHLSNAK